MVRRPEEFHTPTLQKRELSEYRAMLACTPGAEREPLPDIWRTRSELRSSAASLRIQCPMPAIRVLPLQDSARHKLSRECRAASPARARIREVLPFALRRPSSRSTPNRLAWQRAWAERDEY